MIELETIPNDAVCEVCGKDLREGEVLFIENNETKEVVWFHKACLDKVGTA